MMFARCNRILLHKRASARRKTSIASIGEPRQSFFSPSPVHRFRFIQVGVRPLSKGHVDRPPRIGTPARRTQARPPARARALA